MYGQDGTEDIFFMMLYGAVALLALVAAFYLFFRRGNAFASGITPPVALRRFTAIFLGTMFLSHLWWFLLGSVWLTDDMLVRNILVIALDNVTLIPLAMCILLRLLQDRRRRLWPVALAVFPVVFIAVWGIVQRNPQAELYMSVYTLVIILIFAIDIIYAVRQYGYWLADNYADLEHKEVWQSLLAPVCLFPLYIAYTFHEGSIQREYLSQIFSLALVFYLTWRVETLQHLENAMPEELTPGVEPKAHYANASTPLPSNIGLLLERYCEATRLYLQRDLTLAQLAEAVGTNRTYLSQYFAQQGITYNNYIKRLRIEYFLKLYSEAAANPQQPFTAQMLAQKSGFSSYSTFSAAFKQYTGQNVTTWMKSRE